jgi:hypothetical protein
MIADIAYSGRGVARPRYHANDTSLDVIDIAPQPMTLTDARAVSPSLDVEGFALVDHQSALTDFTDGDAVWTIHRAEIAALIAAQTGADFVAVNAPGILRFSERSGRAGSLNNSRPARFAHVDSSDTTAANFAQMSCPEGRTMRRFAHYNIWRAITPPPQDVPLAVCDARSVAPEDLIAADAIFDEPEKPHWSFEGIVVAHNPAHRWHWFPNMHPGEALIFKTNDSLSGVAHCVPHVAFDNPDCPADAPARASIEMRAIAYWFD